MSNPISSLYRVGIIAAMKALFKKLAGSPQRPNSFLESQSDPDLPVKKEPLTPTQVRKIMHASLVSQPINCIVI